MANFFGILASVNATNAQLEQILETGSEAMSFSLNLEGQEFDTTAFAASGIKTFLKGLSSWSATITKRFKTAATGDLGLADYASNGGYVTTLNSWDLVVEVAEGENTPFGSTARTYIPGALSWSGSYSGFQDDTTVLTHPGSASSTNEPATLQLKLREAGATDDRLTGSAFTTLANARVDPNEVATVTYNFRGSGDLTQSTPSAGTTIFPTGVVARPTSDTLVLTATTGQTFTGTAFWTRVAISVGVNRVCTVETTVRGAGALTIA